MQKDDLIRLRHMLDAAQEAISFVAGKSRRDLNLNRMLALSLVKDIEIIGEAASKITLKTREQLAQVPWAMIIGMRNRLIHAYFEIDLDILWKTVAEDIPPLISMLEEIISSEK